MDEKKKKTEEIENSASENKDRESDSKDYEFVTETIKKKPVNKKRLFSKIAFSICMGLLAGIVACLVFVFVEPMLYSRMHPETVDIVSIPKDTQTEETQEVSVTSDVAQDQQSSDNPEGDTSLNIEKVSEDTENSEEEKAEDPEEVTEAHEETPEETVSEGEEEDPAAEQHIEQIYITKDVTLDDYKIYYKEMNTVANIAKRSFATVKGVNESTDWFNNSYESGNMSTGIIVADNGKELLIITNSSKLNSANEIEVTFCNGKSFSGTIKKSDVNTSLVVVAVLLEDIDPTTKNSYAYAQLGNSSLVSIVGAPVIAVGSPLGIDDSIAFGRITSNKRTLEQTDSNIRYLTTDIYGSTDGSGVLIDLEGKVLGIIFQGGGSSSEARNLIHAYSISDIKSKIEKLSNGQEQAYLGIIGTDVTEQAKEQLDVPEGAYVKQVVVDSPAMKTGIQNGDVIVKVGTSDIRSFDDFEEAISKCKPGDIAVVTVKRLGKEGYVEFSYEIYLEALK